MKALTKLSTAIGDGLVAGFLGTAAMTVSSTLEARLRHRAASTAPARATAKALGIADFEDDVARARFNDLSHWGYGTGWGVVRGLLGASGLPPARATAAHGAAIWGSAAGHAARARHRPAVRLLGQARRSPSTSSTTRSTRSPPALAYELDRRRAAQRTRLTSPAARS